MPTPDWPEIKAYLASRRSKSRRGLTLSENIVFPLVKYAWESGGGCDHLLRFAPSAVTSLRMSLCRRLAFAAQATAAYEWQLFLNTALWHEATSPCFHGALITEFFADGIERRTCEFGELYPELRRIWVTQIHNWGKFFHRFCRDAAKFSRRMRFEDRTIIGVQADVSDLHNGNTAVVRVRFRGNEDWFYKPRPAGQAKTWFKLLGGMNKRGFPYPFEIPRIVGAGDHHWMRAVPSRRYVNRQQAHDFWFRAGALLYLVHDLRGVDFHAGNLVCYGDQPIFVDCESLGHTETSMPSSSAAKEKGLFRTGMLPLKQGSDLDVSAFGLMTRLRSSTDLAPRSSDLPAGDAAAGFKGIHSFLTEKATNFSPLHLARRQLQDQQCRLILRPTAHYHLILRHSLTARLLRNATARSDYLVNACHAAHLPDHIAQKEAAALQNIDIPLLLGRAVARTKPMSTITVERAARTIVRALSSV